MHEETNDGYKKSFQMTSNDTYFDDICYNVVKTDDEVMTEGVDYCGPVKASHKGFCLATL